MEYFKKITLDEDQKSILFLVVFLTGLIVFLSWHQGCFYRKSTHTATAQINQIHPLFPAIESELTTFLENSTLFVDEEKGTWFNFDVVNFKSGGTELLPESNSQLEKVAEIRKTHPQAQFKVGGYTDNTGSESLNLEISQKRAEVVYAQLLEKGVPKEQLLSFEGYGSQHPIGDNNTEEGRLKNRRIALRVLKK